jgi:hypothetical protein
MSDFPACQITGGYICFIITPNMLENLEKNSQPRSVCAQVFQTPSWKVQRLEVSRHFLRFPVSDGRGVVSPGNNCRAAGMP